MSGHVFAGLDVRTVEGPAGLTGVWAEENTRESIFNAMKRKETFAVSGPHIKVRFFGGWNYAETATAEQRRAFWKFVPDWIKDRDWVKAAYAQGVPMGGDLTPMPAGDKAPSFAVWAVKDPTSGNLDRIQIIKGWTKSGQSFEKVFDVAWAGDREPDKWTGRSCRRSASTVDIEKATYTNSIGAVELKTVWTDPEFDPSVHAFYYARVLEIPTPRWTTIQAAQLGIAPPDVVAAPSRSGRGVPQSGTRPTAEAQQDRQGWSHRRRSQEAGGGRAQRRAAEGADRRQVPVAAEQRDRHEVQDHLSARRGPPMLRKRSRRIDPAYVTSKLAQNQGQSLIDHAGRGVVQPSADRRSGGEPAILAHPRPITSITARSSP